MGPAHGPVEAEKKEKKNGPAIKGTARKMQGCLRGVQKHAVNAKNSLSIHAQSLYAPFKAAQTLFGHTRCRKHGEVLSKPALSALLSYFECDTQPQGQESYS